MQKHLFTLSLSSLLSLFSLSAQPTTSSLSLSEAFRRAEEQNLSISIAREGVTTARAEGRQMKALWFPTISLAGEYSHSLSEVAAVTTLGEIGGELLGNLEPLIATNPPLQNIVEGVAQSTIRLPLIPRNTAELGVEVQWVVFSGGRRIQASKISDAVVALASQRLSASQEAVRCAVVEAYFAQWLSEQVVRLRTQEVESLSEHLRQAHSLEREGMIVPSERLSAEVAWEQSKARLAKAQSDLKVAHRALSTLLGCDSLLQSPSTPLFLPTSPPTKEFLLAQIANSPTLQTTRLQGDVASLSLSAERGRYFPSVVLVGHQQLLSVGLNKNLFPRTIMGVGLSWTLFDGLSREGGIARARSLVRTTSTALQKVTDDMHLAVEKFYSTMTSAMDEYRVVTHTASLARELLRSRQRAFAEGMTTSSEVVDARLLLTEVEIGGLATLYTLDVALATLLMLTGTTEDYLTYIH